MPSMVLGPGLAISQASAKDWSLQATISHRPIAFVPEGSSLDRCLTLNCGIRD